MISENNFNQNNLRSSVVDTTLTSSCFLSSLSFDQSAQACFNATAKYSTSFGSGDIFFAFVRNCLNSENGTKCTLEEINETANSKSFLERPDFLLISGSCFRSSSPKNSGAKSISSSENNNSCVFPPKEMSAEKKMLASITNSIQCDPGCSFLKRSCMDLLIFLPSSKASFSVNLDLAVMDFKIANWATLSRMAARATSDQFISLNSSISRFRSSGTDKVMVDMFYIPPSHTINVVNTLNTLNIFKCSAG